MRSFVYTNDVVTTLLAAYKAQMTFFDKHVHTKKVWDEEEQAAHYLASISKYDESQD